MEFKQTQAIYLQMADHICDSILRGEWKAETKIPSIREMAVSFEVNPNTVVRTYAYLEEKGIIYTQRGIGYFVAENAYEKVLARRKETFLKQEMKQLFKTMELLKIEHDELKKLHEEYQYENKQ